MLGRTGCTQAVTKIKQEVTNGELEEKDNAKKHKRLPKSGITK